MRRLRPGPAAADFATEPHGTMFAALLPTTVFPRAASNLDSGAANAEITFAP